MLEIWIIGDWRYLAKPDYIGIFPVDLCRAGLSASTERHGADRRSSLLRVAELLYRARIWPTIMCKEPPAGIDPAIGEPQNVAAGDGVGASGLTSLSTLSIY